MARDRTEYLHAYYKTNAERIKAVNHAGYLRNREKVLKRSKEWHKAHRERVNEIARNRYKLNPEAAKAAQKKWFESHREEQLERCRQKGKEAYWKNPEKFATQNKAYREVNGDRIRAQQREYRIRNLAKRRSATRDYHRIKHATDPSYRLKHSLRGKASYEANKKRVQLRHKEWMQKHPGIARAYSQRHRAQKKAVTIKPESIAEWMQRIKSKASAVCHYCGIRIKSEHIHFDHIKALAKGGEHRIENLCVSCPRCNLTKGTAALNEWCKQGQQMLALFT